MRSDAIIRLENHLREDTLNGKVSVYGDLPLIRLRMIVRQHAINGFVIHIDDFFVKKAMTQIVEFLGSSYAASSFFLFVCPFDRKKDLF